MNLLDPEEEEEFIVKEIGELEGDKYKAPEVTPEMTDMPIKFFQVTIYITNTTLPSEPRNSRVENHDEMEKLTEQMKDVKIEQQK